MRLELRWTRAEASSTGPEPTPLGVGRLGAKGGLGDIIGRISANDKMTIEDVCAAKRIGCKFKQSSGEQQVVLLRCEVVWMALAFGVGCQW